MTTTVQQKKIEKRMEHIAFRVFQKMLRNRRVSELLRLAEKGGSFDFLDDEPDLYTYPKHEKR